MSTAPVDELTAMSCCSEPVENSEVNERLTRVANGGDHERKALWSRGGVRMCTHKHFCLQHVDLCVT